jgi:preprotein translocase subunit SecA
MITYIKKSLGTPQERTLKKYQKTVDEINALESDFSGLQNSELTQQTILLKQELENGSTIDEIKTRAFALVREAAKRVLGMRHYDVQLIGGLSLLEGNIAEMPTGEGKTLVASLPSYLRALEGKGVHVITVNEYLAKRDKEITGQILEFLGLTVGLNLADMSPDEKQAAYNADVTYGIGTEFGFDYLRDHMVFEPSQRVQRPYHFAIIDEIDSVLIDEAKTPLIIAAKTELNSQLFFICSQIIKGFIQDKDYAVDVETKAVNFTDAGITKIEKAFSIDNLYDLTHQALYHYLIQSLRAEVIFRRDVDYIIREGKIELIDAFTGRILEGRSLSDGLHQAIEAKEGLQLTDENRMQATVTIQNYFRMYPMLSGMTGTAKTEEKEFQKVYGMNVIQIPTNRPRIRVDMEDIVFEKASHKYKALTAEVVRRHQNGQPILIGTTSIEQSETVADYLDKAGLSYQLLNAKSAEKEAQLISVAGQKNQITIATNMAGRGTDILLGEGVAELGGLHVMGTERHESRRVDNQLKGRAGRQGDPGSSQFFISIEDELIQRFAPELLEKFQKGLKADEAGIVQNKNVHEFVNRVQSICEGSNFSTREYTLKLDDVVNEQRNVIYTLRNRVLEEEDPFNFIKEMFTHLSAHYLESLSNEPGKLEEMAEKLQGVTLSEITGLQDMDELDEYMDLFQSSMEETVKTLVDIHDQEPGLFLAFKGEILNAIDQQWIQHLEAMTRLKEGIGLRGYSQEDPIRLYQKDGLDIFTYTYTEIEAEICQSVVDTVKQAATGANLDGEILGIEIEEG